MLSKREFYDKDFYKYCQQQYDAARFFLKNCGKPTTEEHWWLIAFHKDTARIFKSFLDN